MRIASDAIGQQHDLDEPHQRIVSLVPSTTETVWTLGAEDKLVGVTRYCVRPPEARERCQVMGGTKSPKLDDILARAPDLILANREENRREDIERLMESARVFVFYPRDVATALSDIISVGHLVDRLGPASSLVSEIETRREALARDGSREGFRYLYLIWQNPYMVAGHQTFVDALLAEIGGDNAAPEGESYPEMIMEDIETAGADIILLSSEPFPFTGVHVDELGARLDTPRLLVDGQLLSWHGARLAHAFPYLAELSNSIARARAR